MVAFAGAATGGTGNYGFVWDFGDGSQASAAQSEHAYSAVGTYTAKFTVTDTGTGLRAEQTITFTITSLGADIVDITPAMPFVGDTVSFTGVARDGTGDYSYAWAFGDGQVGSGANASHVYASAGSYDVTMAVVDNGTGYQAEKQLTLTVAARPPGLVAQISTLTPAMPGAGRLVTLTGTASGGTAPYTFTWSFGDNSTGGGTGPTHAWTTPGTYTVTLEVTDSAGLRSTATKDLTVYPPVQATIAAAAPYSPTAGSPITWTVQATGGTGSYTTYTWDYGDGATGSATSHTYTAEGTYTATLSVTDSGGNTSMAAQTSVVVRKLLGNGTLLLSPYKYALVDANASTFIMRTNVSGTTQTQAAAMPASFKTNPKTALTLAFALGDCDNDTWWGSGATAVTGMQFANANIGPLLAANVNYVVSTGGGGNTFTCNSVDLTGFVKRYLSPNLVGVDFDIENSQTQTQIDNLVKAAKATEANFPNLRFSFTISANGSNKVFCLAPPDFGCSAGTTATDLGSNSPQSVSDTGKMVINSIKKNGLTNYSINLMTMWYTGTSYNNCVANNGVCDMAQSSIQAAMNVHNYFSIPYSRIELTNLIGVNLSFTTEAFSLANTATVSSWARSNGLAGLHYWAFDRDKPCTSASFNDNRCNGKDYTAAGNMAFINQFLGSLAY